MAFMPALLHHSDRGSQYTREQFQRLMAGHGVTCSVSRSGNCWDNAASSILSYGLLKVSFTGRAQPTLRDPTRNRAYRVPAYRVAFAFSNMTFVTCELSLAVCVLPYFR
jgi:transposase InsO family protein